MKRFCIVCCFIVTIVTNLFGQSKDVRLIDKLDSLSRLSFFDTSLISLDVYNLSQKLSLFEKNNRLLMRPASNLKVLTAATALYKLGNRKQFTTAIAIDGKISGKVLRGNLYLKGGGDPLFSVDDLDTLVSHIQQTGLRTISGNVFIDVTLFDSLQWGSGWMWDDDPDSDAPYISPLSINANAVAVKLRYFSHGDSVQVTCQPQSKFFAIESQIQLQDSIGTNILCTRQFSHQKNTICIKGPWNRSDSTYTAKISVLQPQLLFLALFKEKCTKAGIRIQGHMARHRITSRNDILTELHHSVYDVVQFMNKVSDNLSAELLLRGLGGESKTSGISAQNGIAYIDSLIIAAGYIPKNYRIVDGSGASHYNMVSTELVDGILKFMYDKYPEHYKILKTSFPIAGVDGTLKRRMVSGNAKGSVFAKTGTISGVSCLSGYVTGRSGKEYSFSVFMQVNSRNLQRAHEIQDAICEVLASQ